METVGTAVSRAHHPTIKILAGIGEPIVGRLLTYDALELRFIDCR